VYRWQDEAVAEVRNPCAGPFGAVYDFYIEREWLSRIVGRVCWGIDVRPLYASMRAVARRSAGATILDVPCGGGVALRALRPDQDVRYIAVDLSDEMLARVARRAEKRALRQVEVVRADICQLPIADGQADLCLSYSGLHAVADPQRALRELVRCLRPGGELVGTTFLCEGTRRQRWFFDSGRKRGIPGPDFTSRDLRDWLATLGIDEVRVEPDAGFAFFSGTKTGRPPSAAGTTSTST
jgi:ubiquinone/menaquinone biosynthesis C-methylase UbiE